MREIEIKARVANREHLITKLAENGVQLSAPIEQHDRVFAIPGASGGDDVPWLRIRTETKDGAHRHIFTLKRSVTGQLDSIEHETEIMNDTEMEKAILAMDLALFSDLTKTRQKAKIGDVEICVDHVEKLGDFIEAETLTNDTADVGGVCEAMWEIFAKLGVARADEVFEGYDVIMKNML